MAKLPILSGYCPPGQLRSMSRRLAQQALQARQQRQWQTSELPAPTLAPGHYLYLTLVVAGTVFFALFGPLLAGLTR